MYVPNTRVDDIYNQDFLSEKDSYALIGYDMAVNAADTFFDNIFPDDLFDMEEEYEKHKEIFVKLRKTFRNGVLRWLESERNMFVMSVIENTPSKEYKEIRKSVLEKNKDKEYYNYEKYECKGKKEQRDESELSDSVDDDLIEAVSLDSFVHDFPQLPPELEDGASYNEEFGDYIVEEKE